MNNFTIQGPRSNFWFEGAELAAATTIGINKINVGVNVFQKCVQDRKQYLARNCNTVSYNKLQ